MEPQKLRVHISYGFCLCEFVAKSQQRVAKKSNKMLLNCKRLLGLLCIKPFPINFPQVSTYVVV